MGLLGGHGMPPSPSKDPGVIMLPVTKLEYAFVPLGIIALACIRLSLLFLYRRFFPRHTVKVLIWILMVLSTVWTVLFAILFPAACGTHLEKHLAPLAVRQHFCVDLFTIWCTMCASGFVLDLAILILPLYPYGHLVTYKSLVSRAQKTGIFAILLLAVFSVAVSLTRLIMTIEFPFDGRPRNGAAFGISRSNDELGQVSIYFWWAFLEIGVGNIVCNLPVLAGFAWRSCLQRCTLTRISSWASTRQSRDPYDVLMDVASPQSETDATSFTSYDINAYVSAMPDFLPIHQAHQGEDNDDHGSVGHQSWFY